MEFLDVLISIRNEYMKDDWRIVGVCGCTEYVEYGIVTGKQIGRASCRERVCQYV